VKKNLHFFRHWLLLLFASLLSHLSPGQTINIYAAPGGTSAGNGTTASAPVNITRAKAIAKAYPQNPCIIWLASGIYPQLSLDASDSRGAGAPVTYQSVSVNAAIFQPQIALSMADFTPIPDAVKSRIIDPTARTKVKQLNLAAYNFTDTAQWPDFFAIGALKAPRFYKNGYPLPMSRYPSDTTMTIRQVVQKGTENSVPGGSFKYRDGRAQYWQNAINDGGVYLSGNWQTPWQMDVIKTMSINTTDSLIQQAVGINNGIGTQVAGRIPSGTEPYYALNLVEEITAEGQWSINFKTKTLYMWVPSSGVITGAGNSKLPGIFLKGVSNTKFIGITVRGGSGDGIGLSGCTNVLIAGAHISYCSGYGVRVVDGSHCTIQSNDIDSVGAGGVIISTSTFAADQAAVKLAGHQVINNHIYSYAREAFLYSAAVDVNYAMGTYVAYNKIHDGPHVGILYGGNNNVFEYNEIYDVVKKYTDMGAFYTYGVTRGWGSRGNKINYNYIHDAPQANGIYLDEFASGDSCSYNIMANLVMAMYNHDGYFNVFTSNICTNAMYPLTCMTQASSNVQYPSFYNALKNLWNSSGTYKKSYPECADMVGPAGRNDAYTSRIWPQATGNVFISNPGVVSNINDHRLFNDDGTTNPAYAQTDPFVNWGLVFKNNIKFMKNLPAASAPFQVDGLRSVGAFGRTGGQNWHINRIGLHKDVYRTDISATRVQGLDPVLSLSNPGNGDFVNPGTFLLMASVKSPNAENTLSSIRFMDNGVAVKGLVLSKKTVTFDSVLYTIQWTNPFPGDHHLVMVGQDGDYWEYSSNTLDFTIKGSSVPFLSVVNDPRYLCSVDLQWGTPQESNVSAYQIYGGSDSAHLKFLFSVNPTCNDGQNCSYSYPLTQNSGELTFYQLELVTRDASSVKSNIVSSILDCTTGQVSLYPNPAGSMVRLNYTSQKAQSNSNVLIYDLLGRVIIQRTFAIQQGLNTLNLPLNQVASGVYLLVMEIENNRISAQRLVVQQ